MPKLWFRFCCVWGIRNQLLFYFNRFRFPLESDVRRNSFSDCTGSLSLLFLFWLVFPVMMIPERFRSSAANYLFTVHWNQSFRCTFLFHLPTWNGTSYFLKNRDSWHFYFLRVSFPSRFECFLFPLKCGSLFFTLILTVKGPKVNAFLIYFYLIFQLFGKLLCTLHNIVRSTAYKKLLCPGNPEQRSSCSRKTDQMEISWAIR